jgi:hypothetical protein
MLSQSVIAIYNVKCTLINTINANYTIEHTILHKLSLRLHNFSVNT